jgi:hypothetical protein
MRISGDGSKVVWATLIGGTGPGFVRDVALDSKDRPVLGMAEVKNISQTPAKQGPQTSVMGNFDSYIAVLSSDGKDLLYGTYMGGQEPKLYSSNPSVRVGASDDIYFATYDYAGVPCVGSTSGAYQSNHAGGTDLLSVHLSGDYSAASCTYFGGSGDEDLETHTLAIAANGDAILGGRTDSTDLPTTSGVWFKSAPGGKNGMIVRLSADGKRLGAATYVGGSGNEEVEGMGIMPSGEIVVGGYTTSQDFPLAGNSFQTSLMGNSDAWFAVVKADLSGSVYGTLFGGSATDSFRAVAVHTDGSVALAGVTGSQDYPFQNAFDTMLNSDASTDQAGSYAVFKLE